MVNATPFTHTRPVFRTGPSEIVSMFVFAGTSIGLGIAGFAWVNVVLTAVWLIVAGQIVREHRRRTA